MTDAGVEPIKTAVVRFKCPFCNRHHARRPRAVDHIARCWSNPENKTCRTCVFFVPAASEADMCGVYGCTCGNFPESCELDIELPENAPVVGCQKWQPRNLED